MATTMGVLARPRWYVLVIPVVVGIVVALTLWIGLRNEPSAGGVGSSENEGFPEMLGTSVTLGPQSIQDLVNRADAIVIGTLGPVVREGLEGPYGTLAPDSRDVPPPLLPFTYYRINVERVLLNDGVILESPTLRVFGQSKETAYSPGTRYLFAMSKNPDGKSYGPLGGWGLLTIEGAAVALPNGISPHYVEALPPGAFVQAVRASIATRQPLDPHEWPRISVQDAPPQTP